MSNPTTTVKSTATEKSTTNGTATAISTATFRPQKWVDDDAHPVDALGDDTWVLSPTDVAGLDSGHLDTDDLVYSRTSDVPDWVRDWDGPFEIDISVI